MAGNFPSPHRVAADPDEPAPEKMLSVVSLNVAKERNVGKILRAIHNSSHLRQADLFLLQEVVDHNGKTNVAGDVAGHLGYFETFAAATPDVHDQGLAIISRHPIQNVEVRRLKQYDLGSRTRSRFALSATMRTPGGNLRLWNAHLDTRINAHERVEQIQPLIREAANSPGAQLIGGDFNTNDVYWFRNWVPLPRGPLHTGAIRRVMEHHEFTTPFLEAVNTFPKLRRHLDWIFVRNAKILAAGIEPAAFSDHHAVWASLSLE